MVEKKPNSVFLWHSSILDIETPEVEVLIKTKANLVIDIQIDT